MGRTLTILLFGFAVSFGILAYSKDRRMLESVDRVVDRVENYSTKNTASSGAFMVLNKLYQAPTWRTGYNVFLANDSLSVVVEDNSDDAAIRQNHIRVTSMSYNNGSADTTQVMIFDGKVNDFAVWSKDSVKNVSTGDSLNNDNAALLMAPAPYMPEINKTALTGEASAQGNVVTGSPFNPPNNYPSANFYYSGSIPNVTYVQGDMHVHNNDTVYGIFVVEGNVYFDPDGTLFGVLYLPNATSSVIHVGGGVDDGRIRGGVITWGTMDGGNNIIRVNLWPSYMKAVLSNYASGNPPMRVIAWK